MNEIVGFLNKNPKLYKINNMHIGKEKYNNL